MADSIEQRAKQASLTKKEKITLDYLIKNMSKACFLNSNEIGRELGIGASSVVRLSSKLGFDSFTDMRKWLQTHASSSRSAPEKSVPYEKLTDTKGLSEPELLAAYTSNIMNHLKADSNLGTEAKIAAAAEAILKAERVFVVGFRSCAGLASTFVTMLTCCRSNVFLVGQQLPLVDQLIGLTSKDLLIALSFHRYSKDTFFAAQMAGEMKARVVVMTDSYAAPLAEFADLVLISSVENFSFFNTYVSLMMNLEKIVLLVSHRTIKSTQKRLSDMEYYLDKTNQY